MKFLYLKGVEVLGPVEVKQLMQESWFSDDLLVCPEDKAEQESAWKSAKDYPEFKASLEQEIFAAEEQQKPLPPAAETPVQVPAVAEENQNTPAAPAAPAATENKATDNQNKMQDLPPLEDTKTESSTDLKKKPEDPIIHDVVEEELPKVTAPIPVNDPQDHTFRIPTEGDDNLLEDLPSESIFDSKEEEEKAPVVLGEENAPKEETSEDNKNKTMDHTSPVEEPVPVQEMEQSVNKHSFMEISNNKILSSSDGRVPKEKKNDLMFILSFIVITVVAVALCLAFFNKKKEMENTNKAAAEQNIEEEPVLVEQEKFQNNPYGQEEQEDILPQQANTISPEEQTIDIVKNTMLKSKGETIGEYFQNVYGENYQTSWSAKPFTEKIYIVEFFASQVRSEPFVYLFRVDIEQQKITGALNNITLDLIG